MSFWDRKKAGQMVGAISFYLDCVGESSKREELCALRERALETERSLSMEMGSVAELQRALCSICHSEAIFNHSGDHCKQGCKLLTIAMPARPAYQRVQLSGLSKGC